MAVPVPVGIAIEPPPDNFKGEYLSDVLNLIASSLSGRMDVELLTGKIGGSQPNQNVGPWLNGTEWYYWTGSKYYPSGQGCPIGTVAIWGGTSNIPTNWLLCEGQGVPTATYPDLFTAIGYTWGGSGGTFKLPPSAVFFVNAAGFVIDAQVPNTPGSGIFHVNARGGAQTAIIPTDAMPALQVELLYINADMIDNNINVPNTQGAGSSGYYYPVCDENGVVLGTNQQRIAIMPPFAAANFIIKYL